MKVDCNHPQHQIKNGDVLLTYIGMQCMGKPSFDAVHEMDDDPDFYKAALGIYYGIPSAETLRQRLDLIGSSIRGPDPGRERQDVEIQRHRAIKAPLWVCPGRHGRVAFRQLEDQQGGRVPDL